MDGRRAKVPDQHICQELKTLMGKKSFKPAHHPTEDRASEYRAGESIYSQNKDYGLPTREVKGCVRRRTAEGVCCR